MKKLITLLLIVTLTLIPCTNTYAATKKTKKSSTIKVSKSDMRLLCAITYAEAGIEPYRGKIGVMNVIINRRNKSKSKSFKKVIYARGQFSPTWNGALNRELRAYDRGRFKKDKSRIQTVKAVKAALAGKNTVGKRTHFNEYSGVWHKNGKRIGTHIFW